MAAFKNVRGLQKVFNKMSWLAVAMISAAALLSGCSTTASFSHTPVAASEFTKNIDELKQGYSDIEKYDRIFASPASAPQKNELETLWGAPAVKKKWTQFAVGMGLLVGLTAAGYVSYPILLAGYLLAPTPSEEYVWKKGHYEITARGRNDALVLYEKRIHRWTWEEKASAESVELSSRSIASQ